jgi:hypothetical protein
MLNNKVYFLYKYYIILLKYFKNFLKMTDAFYKDLKIVEDNLFEHTYIEKFINVNMLFMQTYPITTILNNIVKNSNSKNRIIL